MTPFSVSPSPRSASIVLPHVWSQQVCQWYHLATKGPTVVLNQCNEASKLYKVSSTDN